MLWETVIGRAADRLLARERRLLRRYEEIYDDPRARLLWGRDAYG